MKFYDFFFFLIESSATPKDSDAQNLQIFDADSIQCEIGKRVKKATTEENSGTRDFRNRVRNSNNHKQSVCVGGGVR